MITITSQKLSSPCFTPTNCYATCQVQNDNVTIYEAKSKIQQAVIIP